MSDDLSREIGLALADLERMAPPAPALDDIKSRRTVLYAVRPRRRWSSTAAVFAAAAVTVAIVLVAALVATNMGGTPAATDSTSTSSTPTAVVPAGTWLIESVTVAGTTTQIDATATIDAGYEPPRVTFVDGRIEGWTGCNEFSRGPVQVADRLLTVGDEGFINAAGCPEDRPDFAIVEDAILDILFQDEVRVDLAISDETMEWSVGGTAATFSRTPTLSSQEEAYLQAQAWLAQCAAALCHSQPTLAPGWIDDAARALIASEAPHVEFLNEGEQIFDDTGAVRDGRMWIEVGEVRPTDVEGVVQVNTGVVFAELAGEWRTYLYRRDAGAWVETTSEESGVPVTTIVS